MISNCWFIPWAGTTMQWKGYGLWNFRCLDSKIILLALWQYESYLTTLSLGFHIYKMGITQFNKKFKRNPVGCHWCHQERGQLNGYQEVWEGRICIHSDISNANKGAGNLECDKQDKHSPCLHGANSIRV